MVTTAVIFEHVTWLQLGLLFFVVSVITGLAGFSVYAIAFPETTAADRLEALTTASEATTSRDLMVQREQRAVEALAARLGKLAQPETADAAEALRRKLMHAGYKSRRAPEVFAGVRVAAFVVVPVLLSPALLFMEPLVATFAMLLGAIVGYFAPPLILESQAISRQAELLRSYPDSLDLMVSSVESGLSLDQAFKRVALEMKTVSPPLSKEYTLVNSQTAAGIDRITALKRLEERTGLEEVRSFVNMLSQAERFGSSVAASMRLYSQVAREKRMARAEEKAGQVGSKLTIIMILFFLPVLLLMLVAPPAVKIWYGEEFEE